MSQVIYKFRVLVGQPTVHEMPPAAKIQRVEAPAPDTLLFWALVDPNVPTARREFKVAGTGQEVDESWRYAGTAPAPAGLVWHLFSRPAR